VTAGLSTEKAQHKASRRPNYYTSRDFHELTPSYLGTGSYLVVASSQASSGLPAVQQDGG